MFLKSRCPAVNLLSLYKDQQEGKFIIFKVIKLTLIGAHSIGHALYTRRLICIFLNVMYILVYFPWLDSAGGLNGYEILKVHDADPFLGVEVKFVDVTACQQFLESYSSGAVLQSLSQHACRLLALSQEFTVETQLKASTHILDLYLDKLDLCLQHIHLSQVCLAALLVCSSPFDLELRCLKCPSSWNLDGLSDWHSFILQHLTGYSHQADFRLFTS